MRTKTQERFVSIKVEGAVLPTDLLRRIAAGDKTLDGMEPVHYHLAPGERINEAVSRAWNRLMGLWQSFKDKKAGLGPEESGTGMTREQWLLPLFQELGYGRLQRAQAYVMDDKEYPISHTWLNSPIHLMGCGVDLDRRKKGEPGASSASPHSLVQEFLNRSDEHLWGFVSNGLKLRLLRDNVSLTRQAFIEFDLEIMMEAEVYPDFVLLWLLCHQSRVEGDKLEECWLENWHQLARESGVRILENLRDGVEKSITAFGRGFLSHKANKALIEKLQSGVLSTLDFYRQLLRLVYRLIFLLVAESRDLLIVPDALPEVRERYENYYSISRLRELAERRRGSSHTDLWLSVKVIFQLLGKDEGYPDLGLPGLGSFLWSEEAVPDVMDCIINNREFLKGVYYLSFMIDKNVRHRVDYKNLGPEELGSVYEALLELHPDVNSTAGTFELRSAGGSERKTTGSYYTPASLIVSLLDSALEPVLRERKTEEEILALKVCDPACGSGHFLLAAAHRIARRLAALRTGEPEPAPSHLRTAMRDVIGRCIYGVDINPMSVELCKVGLWMEALEPGKPLSFLDHRILCGNSLMGAYPALMKKGIPDEAFKPIEGDDKKVCQKYRSLNKQEKGSMSKRSLYDAAGEGWFGFTDFSPEFVNLDTIDDSIMEGIRRKQAVYKQMTQSDDYIYNRLVADAWCAAFVWKKIETQDIPYPIHEEVFQNIERNPMAIPGWMKDEINRLSKQYRFFHFHLAFPDVFPIQKGDEVAENSHTGWSGGFDVVLGNPPWERIKLQEKEWFAAYRPDITDAANADTRYRMIENLKTEDPGVYNAFIDARRQAEGESHFIRNSGKFPLCGRGDVNTYTIFAETNRELITSTGRVGCIVPSGIATDDTTKYFFQDLVNNLSLVSLYDFENRKGIFPAVHRSYKFCLLTLTGKDRPVKGGAEFIFFALDTTELREKERRFTLTAEDIALVNPNSRTCPIFRFNRDAELVKQIYKRIPVLIEEEKEDGNPWAIKFLRMFDMANDSSLFRTKEDLFEDACSLEGNIFRKDTEYYYPLYEAKMIHHFNHRFGDYNDLPENSKSVQLPDVPEERMQNPNYSVLPRYWIEKQIIDEKLSRLEYKIMWLIGWRDICRSTDERTIISSIFPRFACGDTLLLMLPQIEPISIRSLLISNLNSFISDYIARQKVGGVHLKYNIFKQLAILSPEIYKNVCLWYKENNLMGWIIPRVLELTYTAWDLQGFARDVGYEGPPFVWDEERRFLMRCELDAAYFHLYGISAEDVDYIMDTFPIVKRKDQAAFRTYRTKDKILEIFQQMEKAIATGKPYQTKLDPPPGDSKQAHSDNEKYSNHSIIFKT
jgi:hypothetical protein